jgi:chitin synthase
VKDEGHGGGGKAFTAEDIPLRRWEDWERSRLRKLRRDERRRRDFERSHPSGYLTGGDGDSLGTRSYSHYEGSDAASLTPSEEDQWGGQIGGYNEHHAQYPPPPVGLLPAGEQLLGAKVVDRSELEAMLEKGFEEPPSQSRTPPNTYPPRFQLSDANAGYAPISDNLMSPTSPGHGGASSGVGADWKTHAKRRSGGGATRYGPLGPLDPGTRF